MRCLKYLLQKEFIQFRRNSFLPKIIFVFPVAIMLIAPIVTNMDVKHVGARVKDNDNSSLSRQMASHIFATDYFTAGDDVVITIPEGFERSLASGDPKKMLIEANGVNATKGTLGMQYALQSIAKAIGAQTGVTAVKYMYNPMLDYRFNMIPAFIIILVLMVCCFIPALNIVLEKENGTIEQINVTPVSRLEFTLSKLLPYWLIGLVVVTEGILVAGWVYGLWPAGSTLALYFGAMLFTFAMSGFAVSIANRAETMQQSIFILFFFVMVFMLMSGLLTPLSSMPRWAQIVAHFFPPTYFVQILRAIYLKGTLMSELAVNYWALAGFGVAFSILAALTYRKRQ